MTARSNALLVLALTVALALTSLLRARSMDQFVASATYEDVFYLPPADWLRPLSLGYETALADLLWLRALVYFGEEMMARGAMAHIFDYAEGILELDPDFRAVYGWIATAGVYHPLAITASAVERSIAIMRRGLERFPDDGALAWDLGTTMAFELPPLLEDASARDAARSEGADYMAIAARLGGAPPWVTLSSATLLARLGRADAAVRHLEEMYAIVSDDQTRAQIQSAIANLRNSAYSEAFVESNRVEEIARARELPYVAPDLYFVLGPRPAVDWRERFHDGFHVGVLAEPASALLDQ